MGSSVVEVRKLSQIRVTRTVLLLITAVFTTIILTNSVKGTIKESSPLLATWGGLSPLSRNPRDSISGVGTETIGNNDLDSDPDFGEEIANTLVEIGNATIEKKGEGSLLSISSNETTFSTENATDSSLNSGGYDPALNSSVHWFPSSPIYDAPSAVLPDVAVKEKPLRPKKHGQASKTCYITDMEQLLIQNRASPRLKSPRWPSPVDHQILEARAQIENTPMVTSDSDLYAPGFRNISMFKRSYGLMEQILKVYVYKEGDRPIFHAPSILGVYASEGWFMKQMEESKKFVVGDPKKAHLFYMPFSSVTLRTILYNSTSHSKKMMIQHLRNYVRTISSEYPFWNRTGGADHFLAGCHDWATRVTSFHMSTSIRAVCTADVHAGFEIGKDVSLPVTRVFRANNPLHGLGGKPPRKRTLLAFFAGQMHGYLRPILLQHWENKDPAMKIIGMMPGTGKILKEKKKNSVKMNYTYIDYMKDSKYCICPRGYEVNSPRIIEAIFYECVPVIISDNFVPPFFEILNWEAFSLILSEKDVPRLKEILLSIPWKKYEALQMGVRGIQKHFLWNKKPVKYDLFHMILHNIWLNRIYQLRVG